MATSFLVFPSLSTISGFWQGTDHAASLGFDAGQQNKKSFLSKGKIRGKEL